MAPTRKMKDHIAPSPKVRSSNVRNGAILSHANHDEQKRRSDHPSMVNSAPVRLASTTRVHRSGTRVLIDVADLNLSLPKPFSGNCTLVLMTGPRGRRSFLFAGSDFLYTKAPVGYIDFLSVLVVLLLF